MSRTGTRKKEPAKKKEPMLVDFTPSKGLMALVTQILNGIEFRKGTETQLLKEVEAAMFFEEFVLREGESIVLPFKPVTLNMTQLRWVQNHIDTAYEKSGLRRWAIKCYEELMAIGKDVPETPPVEPPVEPPPPGE